MKVVIGLPSRNESKSIREVVYQIDEGLLTLRIPTDCLLVNADCQSTDGTLKIFSSCKTFMPKRAISCEVGKGSAVLAIMKVALQEEADGIFFIDTDLPAIPIEWLSIFLALAHEGFDLILPRRQPTWNGGDLTYQLCFSMLTALWGTDIQNPIAGELFISAKLVENILSFSWPEFCLGYGVDFLIAQAGIQLKWAEAD